MAQSQGYLLHQVLDAQIIQFLETTRKSSAYTSENYHQPQISMTTICI